MKHVKGFHWFSKAWYNKDKIDDTIMFGLYSTEGGCKFEMAMRWHPLGAGLTPRLEVFSDAWPFLKEVKPVLEALSMSPIGDMKQEEFVGLLKGLGYKDLTSYVAPDERV
jgi:hypothetical protein